METKYKNENILKNFVLCGLIGWCSECLWTGLGSIRAHTDRKLPCHTSMWMFPIYGMAAVFPVLTRRMQGACTLVRGGVYMLGIFAVEFLTGSLLQRFRSCPWDYSKARWNVRGVIRLDYAPVWFGLGLLYERILSVKKGEEQHGGEKGAGRSV